MSNIPIETVKKILDLRREKHTYREISKALNVSKDCVRKYCILYELDKVEVSNPNLHYSQELKDKIKDMYLNQGMTPSEIGKKLNRNTQSIREFLNRIGARKVKPSNKYSAYKAIDKVKLPDPIVDPVFYPTRKITPKVVNIGGKKYQDVSEFYGL